MAERSVLLSTIMPSPGGVYTMLSFVLKALRRRGLKPVVAHYQPYSLSPDMSVPAHKVLFRRPVHRDAPVVEGSETHAIGAWLPELEFTHYLAIDAWKRLMDESAAFLSVSGNVLPATPYYQTGRPYLAWVATGREEDRRQRFEAFPPLRRLVDRALVSPVADRLERRLLRRGAVMALSRYTQRSLGALAGGDAIRHVLPMPVDAAFFSPDEDAVVDGRIGFSGRLSDPRKNVGLLIEAIAIACRANPHMTAVLIGGEADEAMRDRVAALGIADRVEFVPVLDHVSLRARLRTIDVYVVPSYQEGLCIAALEAMACGCPVVSTRCGGPEEFVIDGETGYLVGFEPSAMADAILRIAGDRDARRRMSAAARALVARDYSFERAEAIFWSAFARQFPELETGA